MSPAAGHGDGVANHNVVFVNTSLDTHLAMIVSESDTVSDFKRKIMLEHRQLFPAIGDIKVECLKIKRRGSFYHLSDSMLVKTAFSGAKRNWFVSVDASRLEHNDGVQRLGKRKAGDQLALPWVTHSRSVERHDSHGSPSTRSKTVPSLNQKVLNVDQVTSGDSCKDVINNDEEDRSCNDKQLGYELQEQLYTVNTDINSKKRTRDVHDESLLEDACESGPSVKKRRKTQRVKGNVKASQENIALTYDKDKVNDKGASINNEGSSEPKLKGKDSSDESNRINEGEKCSALDQVATIVPSIEGVGSETVGDVAMVVENNIQQEMSIGISQKGKDSELIQKPAMENEIHSSMMRTTDCELDAAGVTAMGLKKRSTKHKAAEKEVFSASSVKELLNTNKDAIESSSQQDVGSNGQECAGDQIDKYKDDSEISLKQRPELKLPERKKGAMEHKKRKTRKLFKHSDSLVGDISSMVPASLIDERKMNEDSEKTLIDHAKKGDDAIVKEMEISVENMEEKSRKEFADTNDVVTATNEDNAMLHSESLMNNDAEISTAGKNTSQVTAEGILNNLEKQNEKMDDATKKKKKRKTKKSAGRNEDESITKNVDGDIFGSVKECESGLPDAGRKDGDMSLTVLAGVAAAIDERITNEVAEETLIEAKNNDDVIAKEVGISVEHMENGAEIPKTGENISQVNAQGILDNLEKQNEKMEDATKKKKKRKTKKSAGRNEDESTTKHVDGDIFENVKERESGLPDADRKDGDMPSTVLAAGIDERKMNEDSERTLIDAKKGDDVIEKETEISVENMEEKSRKEFTDTNDAEISTTGKNTSQVNALGILDNLEKQNEKKDDTTKKKKKRKTKKSDEVELESKKSQSVDHHLVPEKTLKNVAASQVSKVNKDVDITEDGSHELNFKDYFAPVHQPNKIASINNRKDMKKRKDDSRNDQSQKLVSKAVNNKVSTDVLKDPNVTDIDKMKTPKRTKKIDVQKTNKQQSISGQSHFNTVKKKNGTQLMKGLLNTPGTIFGDDSDDNESVNSDSSTRSPSRKSSSSSSSGESVSKYSLRNRSIARKHGNNNINSGSKSKDSPIMDALLRRSSGFKKAKVTASQLEDTESQLVDFVPDSQPI